MQNQRAVDFGVLVPEIKAWNGGNGIPVEHWAVITGSVELAIGYSRLFWPNFVEHDGCVLVDGFSKQTYADFMDQCAGDRTRVKARDEPCTSLPLLRKNGPICDARASGLSRTRAA